MSTWYYYDTHDQKLGPYSGGQLKWLAKNGILAPETIVETEDGKKTPARKIKGLTFIPQAEIEAMQHKQVSDTVLSRPTGKTTDVYKIAPSLTLAPLPPQVEEKFVEYVLPLPPVIEANPFVLSDEEQPLAVPLDFDSVPAAGNVSSVPRDDNPFVLSAPKLEKSGAELAQQDFDNFVIKPKPAVDENTFADLMVDSVKQENACNASNPFTKAWSVSSSAPSRAVYSEIQDDEGEEGKSSWLITVIGIIIIAVIGFAGWGLIETTSPADTASREETVVGGDVAEQEISSVPEHSPINPLPTIEIAYDRYLDDCMAHISSQWLDNIARYRTFSSRDSLDSAIKSARILYEDFEHIDEWMKMVRDHVKDLDKTQYENTIKLYSILSLYEEAIKNPSGSANSYAADLQEYRKEFTRTLSLAKLEWAR